MNLQPIKEQDWELLTSKNEKKTKQNINLQVFKIKKINSTTF
jgi:hypothetical protein